jgi:glycosyltransferase involved in cell wall biosynthesis
MKIIIAASYGPSLLNFRKDLIKEMIKKGHSVTCISVEPKEMLEEPLAALGASYESVGGSRTGLGFLENLAIFFCYLKLLFRLKPDLCFFYMPKPIVFGGTAAIILGIKRIYPFITGLETPFYSKAKKDIFIRVLLCVFYKFVIHFSKACFFMNQDDINRMRKLKVIRKEKAVLVNGSGVNMEHFTRLPLPEEPRICMTARLVEGKGVREYFEAALLLKNKYPEVPFLLVGGFDEHKEGIKEEELDALLKEGAVDYYGYAEDVRPYLEYCSIFVLPSYHEGNGRSIVEAMAAGRAIVTTNVPGCRDTVMEGYNGFLVPPRDGRALAEKLEVLIQNKKLRESMGKSSYLLCREKFEVNKINNTLLQTMGL